MPPLTSPPSARTLVSSLLTELSSLSPDPPDSTTRTRGPAGLDKADEHISDSEASSSSSSPSAPSPPRRVGEEAISSSLKITSFLQHPRAKSLLATLHCLFPNYLLPALDVLDRRLVTRLVSSSSASPPVVVYDVRSLGSIGVRGATAASSSSHRHSHQRSRGMTETESGAGNEDNGNGGNNDDDENDEENDAALRPGYEVRLRAWHCTCAAFAFGCAECDEDDDADEDPERSVARPPTTTTSSRPQSRSWLKPQPAPTIAFGGLYRAAPESPPICKHLLACLLAETCLPLRASIRERHVSVEEMAGWAAGWI